MTRYLPCAAMLLLVSACGGGFKADAPAGDGADGVKPVALVRVAPATPGVTSSVVTAYGVTEAGPGASRSIIAPVEAIVAAVLAPTGTAVRAGSAVVTLRPSRTTRLEAVRAGGDARTAGAALARSRRLRRDGLVSDADVETARAASAAASATLASVGVGANGVTLRSPAEGTVELLTVKVGDQVAAGTSIATVAGRGDLRARFGVDPTIASRIRPGQVVQLQLSTGGAPVPASVVGVDPGVDATTRLASVFVRIPGGLSLSPGQPLRATVQVGTTSTTLSVPYAALLDDGGRSYVFVIRKGGAKRVDVSPGNSSGDNVEILSGLQPGDTVVTEGGTALEDGMRVRVAGTRTGPGAGSGR